MTGTSGKLVINKAHDYNETISDNYTRGRLNCVICCSVTATHDFRIKGAKVFAECNEIGRQSRPLQSRFRCLHLPTYTEEQFPEVSAKVLPKLKIAHVIGKSV